jgi:hypothetical protein
LNVINGTNISVEYNKKKKTIIYYADGENLKEAFKLEKKLELFPCFDFCRTIKIELTKFNNKKKKKKEVESDKSDSTEEEEEEEEEEEDEDEEDENKLPTFQKKYCSTTVKLAKNKKSCDYLSSDWYLIYFK